MLHVVGEHFRNGFDRRSRRIGGSSAMVEVIVVFWMFRKKAQNTETFVHKLPIRVASDAGGRFLDLPPNEKKTQRGDYRSSDTCAGLQLLGPIRSHPRLLCSPSF